MRATETVVSDTSPILNLPLIDRLDLLRSQFDSLLAPSVVRDELFAGEDGLDSVRTLFERDVVTVTDPERSELILELRSELDVGEAAAITLAIERDVDRVLVDERDGRQVARRHGPSATGVVGILLRGAREGDVAIEPALEQLGDAGFWIGDDLFDRAVDAVEDDGE